MGEPVNDTLILSVSLASGNFESSLRVPLKKRTRAENDELVKTWLDMIMTGFRISAEKMDVVLGDKDAPHS